MDGIKEKLEKAIITNNWEIVREVYKYLFDQTAPKFQSNPANTEYQSLFDDLRNIANLLYNKLTDIGLKYKIMSNKIENKSTSNPSLITDAATLVEDFNLKTKPDTRFVSGISQEEAQIPNYEELVLETNKAITQLRQSRDPRDPYKPIIKLCESCKEEFDYKKEYPEGHFSSQILCNKCQSKNKKR